MIQCEECDAVAVAEQARQESERDKSAANARLKASGLPRPYRDGRRDWGVVVGEIGDSAACVDFLATGRGLYIHGPAGSHKTSIACAWLAKEIRAGAHGTYCYAPDLFSELFAAYSTGSAETRRDVIERYAETPKLLLDDIDKAKISVHSAEIIGSIFDFRYREERHWNIVTSNCSLDELARRFESQIGETYAEPLLRRIAEMTESIPMARAESQS
jgi:DNA replication protein DnaC